MLFAVFVFEKPVENVFLIPLSRRISHLSPTITLLLSLIKQRKKVTPNTIRVFMGMAGGFPDSCARFSHTVEGGRVVFRL